jgi:rhamnosyltransferase
MVDIQFIQSNNRVAVLLATYNGKEWIHEQIQSISNQSDVDVVIFVSDDCSSDGTLEYLTEVANFDRRIILLPKTKRMGSAGKNFYRLIRNIDVSAFDYMAFADQDDIWNTNKLSSHLELIRANDAEAVSSNVMAFWSDGRQKLIVKSQAQKNFDFLFESAGPGCTFLMTPWLVNQVKKQLLTNPVTDDIELHDWLIYAICRAHNKRWVIDPTSSIQYRQHLANAFGANSGLKPALTRLKKIKSGWYRHQVAMVSRVVASINHEEQFLSFQKIIHKRTTLNQLRLLPYAFQGRRKLKDRIVLTLSILLFIF